MFPVIGAVAGAVGSFVGNQLNQVIAGFQFWAPIIGAVAGAIGSFVGGQLQQAIAGFQFWAAVIGTVVGAFGGLWNVLSNAAATAGRLAGNIGSAIVNGIKDGVNSAIGTLSGALHALAMLLPDVVKNALGIHSPSAVFADQVGQPIVEGIAAGITRSGAAVDALQAHARMLSGVGGAAVGGGMSGNYGVGGGAGGGGGGVVVQVTVQGNVLNWNDTAAALAGPIRDALLRTKRTTGNLGLA